MDKPFSGSIGNHEKMQDGAGSPLNVAGRQTSRPPFWEFYRSTWFSKKYEKGYGRYRDKDSIILCRDGRVFREKRYALYNVVARLFPFLFPFIPLIDFIPWPDTSGITSAAQRQIMYDVYHHDKKLIIAILALFFLGVFFIILPLVRYFLNSFKQIREDDAYEFNNEFFDLYGK